MTMQQLLDSAFPQETDANLIRGVSEGIFLADSTLDSTPFLSSDVGADLRGHLRRSGILFRLHELCTLGDLPFNSTMSRMPRGNWHWTELQSGNFTSHVCRTDAPELFPVDSPTRQDDRVTNQGDLFFDTSSVIPIRGYFAWLTFGAGHSGSLGHLCWGMPSAKEDAWLARTNILRRAHENESFIPKEPATAAAKLKFRDHVEESLLDREGEQGEEPAE